MTSDTVLVHVDDGVATVTLNRPEVRNAFDLQMSRDLPEALWGLEADDLVRAIVLTGAGTAFCAGADISQGADAFGAASLDEYGVTNNGGGQVSDSFLESFALWKMRTPVIAAINGAAIGGGLTLALLTDIRFAAVDAKLRFPFTRIGMTPEGNATWLLPRLVGMTRAAHLLLLGRWFSGREAAEIGLVSEALPSDEVLPAAQDCARDIAQNTAPHAVAATKYLLYRYLEMPDRDLALAEEASMIPWAGSQPDTAEAVTAMLEKRKPVWTGSKHVELPENLASAPHPESSR